MGIGSYGMITGRSLDGQTHFLYSSLYSSANEKPMLLLLLLLLHWVCNLLWV
jgi:hypothetical protein